MIIKLDCYQYWDWNDIIKFPNKEIPIEAIKQIRKHNFNIRIMLNEMPDIGVKGSIDVDGYWIDTLEEIYSQMNNQKLFESFLGGDELVKYWFTKRLPPKEREWQEIQQLEQKLNTKKKAWYNKYKEK